MGGIKSWREFIAWEALIRSILHDDDDDDDDDEIRRA